MGLWSNYLDRLTSLPDKVSPKSSDSRFLISFDTHHLKIHVVFCRPKNAYFLSEVDQFRGGGGGTTLVASFVRSSLIIRSSDLKYITVDTQKLAKWGIRWFPLPHIALFLKLNNHRLVSQILLIFKSVGLLLAQQYGGESCRPSHHIAAQCIIL